MYRGPDSFFTIAPSRMRRVGDDWHGAVAVSCHQHVGRVKGNSGLGQTGIQSWPMRIDLAKPESYLIARSFGHMPIGEDWIRSSERLRKVLWTGMLTWLVIVKRRTMAIQGP